MISPKFRKFISGSPQVVIHHGVLDKMKLRTLRMSQDDLQEALRGLDIFDINEVEFAVVETNGQISAYQKEPYRNAEKQTSFIALRTSKYNGVSHTNTSLNKYSA